MIAAAWIVRRFLCGDFLEKLDGGRGFWF